MVVVDDNMVVVTAVNVTNVGIDCSAHVAKAGIVGMTPCMHKARLLLASWWWSVPLGRQCCAATAPPDYNVCSVCTSE